MPRAGRPKVRQYSLEFKLKAVKLSQLSGVEVQAVAEALEIHPFMLSRWRKEACDGVLRGRVPRPEAVTVPRASQVKQLQALRRKHAVLEEEHALLKNSSGSPPHENRCLRVHRRSPGTVRCDAARESVSLVVTVYAREGIVMAADSRLTLTYQRTPAGQPPHTVSVTSSDSARELFLTPVVSHVVPPEGIEEVHRTLRDGTLVGRGAVDWNL